MNNFFSILARVHLYGSVNSSILIQHLSTSVGIGNVSDIGTIRTREVSMLPS